MYRRKETRIGLAIVACVLAGGLMGTGVAQEPQDRGLGSCENITVVGGLLSSTRPGTINDIQQSWVGSDLSKLVGGWGAPTSTFENRDGTRILSWKDSGWSSCTQTFEVDAQDVVTRWNNSNCSCINGDQRRDRVSKSTPIPRMTL